jgi:hypothetical protein
MRRIKVKFVFGVVAAMSLIAISKPQGRSVRYTGQVVSIDFEGDIRDFLQRIAPISGFDIRVAPEINRAVTVHLKDIPWDLALEVVLKNSGLSGEMDGSVLRIATAEPLRSENRLQVGTMTIEGKISAFQLQNPRTLLQVDAPDGDGKMQDWRIEWESADNLAEIGIRPNMIKVGDQVIVTGNPTRPGTLRLVILRRPSDGFSWGDINSFSSEPLGATMFVSSRSK